MSNTSRKKVVVTGAGGHLGYNLVNLLIEKGYQVRATVRNPGSEAAQLLAKMNVEIVTADVLQPQTLKKAFEGCDGLFHLAAVYQLYSKNPEEEIIRPACEGTTNVIKAAHEAGIKKVVMTSSIAAVGSSKKGGNKLDEKTYNDGATDPYFYAKTKSEKIAWELSQKLGIKLVTVLPGMILGGGFFNHTPSTKLVDRFLYGKLLLVIPGTQNYVDARDVAAAHLIVYESEDAQGRYLATGDSMSMWSLAWAVRKIRPWGMMPLFCLPSLFIALASPLDRLNEIVLGEDRYFDKHTASEIGNRYQIYDNSKLKSLGWKPRELKDTLKTTIEWIESHPYLVA